ncbi:MAG: HTTM domain-containing protein [Planctomycetota bacterium]
MTIWQRIESAADKFLFASCDPRTASMLRIGYALLLTVNTLVWLRDAELWFSGAGILRVETAEGLSGPQRWSLLFLLPGSPQVVKICLILLLLHGLFMLLGLWSRVQAACIFVWLVSFQNRNPLICDGEDAVFRVLAFLMVFLPLDYAWSLSGRSRDAAPLERANHQAWGLRLVQIEMTAIYLSSALSKLHGLSWRDGSALYYVSRMDDYFGRPGTPLSWFDSPWFVTVATWAVLAIELVVPIALWFRPTRRYAIVVGAALHLAIELSMNLFLFQWLMIVGLTAFVKPEEWRGLSWRQRDV